MSATKTPKRKPRPEPTKTLDLTPLAPCPFCHGRARFIKLWTLLWSQTQTTVEQGRIVCGICGARTDTGTIETATQAWNRRP